MIKKKQNVALWSNGVLLNAYYRSTPGLCGGGGVTSANCEKYRTYNHSLLISSILSIGLFSLAFLFS